MRKALFVLVVGGFIAAFIIPAYHWGCPEVNPQGRITFCFELSPEEKKQVLETGRIYLTTLGFFKPLQPIWGSLLPPEDYGKVKCHLFSTDKPEEAIREGNKDTGNQV